MTRFAADENFDNDVLRALARRRTSVDVVRVQDVGLRNADDETVLDWAASAGRVLLTQDVRTMAGVARRAIEAGRPMAGVFQVGRNVAISELVTCLELLARSDPAEWAGQIRFVPF